MTSSIQQVPDSASGAEKVNPAPNPVRRSFTAEYRARVVAEYEAAPHGEKAGVLRREGLYQSQVREWKAERDARAAGLVPQRTSHRATRTSASETDRLRAENARLTSCRRGWCACRRSRNPTPSRRGHEAAGLSVSLFS